MTWKTYGDIQVRYNTHAGGWQALVDEKVLREVFDDETAAVAGAFAEARQNDLWGLRGDVWIEKMCLERQMITPYIPELVAEDEDGNPIISKGQSSYGYDISVADEFKLYHNLRGGVIDPKNTSLDTFINIKVEKYIDIPPNSFVLAKSVEYIRMLPNVLVILLGKSTLARCGLVLNFTPLEPGWEGFITIEISNTMPLPVRVYANEGIAQALFFQSPDQARMTYDKRAGKYHRALDMQLPIV